MIENSKNLRENIFDFKEDKVFEKIDILELIKKDRRSHFYR